jgi:uncharacterized membrane protein YfhO
VLLRRGTDTERWSVDAPAGGFLRVSGRYDRGWSARVDGRAVPVLRADGVFRGAVLPAGRHVVTFRYRNRAEHAGRWLALAGLLAVAALVVPQRRRHTDY